MGRVQRDKCLFEEEEERVGSVSELTGLLLL